MSVHDDSMPPPENSLNSPSTHKISVLFGFAFLTSAAYVLSSAIGMSLYLSRVGAASLPVVLVASAVSVVFVSSLTYALMLQITPRRCIVVAWWLLAIASASLSWQLRDSDHSAWVLGLIYVLAEIRGCLNTVFLTTLMTDTFRGYHSKRPYTLVAAGAPLAGIVAGIVLTWGAGTISVERMLQLIAGLDIAVVVLSFWLARGRARPLVSQETADDPVPATTESTATALPNYRFFLAAVIVLKTVVLTLIGFQWKVATSEYWHENEVSLIVYFAIYYALSDVCILLMQIFLAGRLLDRYGIGAALRGYPLLLALSGIGAMIVDSPLAVLVLFTIARGLDVVRRSIHDPALASAFAVLDHETRHGSIVVIKGIAKPIAEVITSLVLLLLASEFSRRGISAVWWLFLIPWFIAAVAAGRTSSR
jgi:hypothetical protein